MRWQFQDMELRWLVLPFLSVGVQFFVVYVGLSDAGALRRFLFVFSYLLLVPFIWINRRYLGVVAMGAGIALNFLAIVSNGGLMPLDPETVERVGQTEKIADVRLGEPVPDSKNVLLERDNTRFWFLSDVLSFDNPVGLYAFSAGDVVIVAGMAVLMGSYAIPRRRPV